MGHQAPGSAIAVLVASRQRGRGGCGDRRHAGLAVPIERPRHRRHEPGTGGPSGSGSPSGQPAGRPGRPRRPDRPLRPDRPGRRLEGRCDAYIRRTVAGDPRHRQHVATGQPRLHAGRRSGPAPDGRAAHQVGGDAEPDGKGVRLTPDAPLTPGTVYRFALPDPDGRTLDSWAFQAAQPLSVIETLPEDHESGGPLDSGIEITFDQDGVTDAASHVTISPKSAGRFEQHGRVLVFVPDRLKPRTVYTVTVAKGVTAPHRANRHAHDVRFQFETTNPGKKARSAPR